MVAAMGDAPEISITANTLTDLGSCDSNRVRVVMPTGVSAMTIQDFGSGAGSTHVTKRVKLPPGLTIKHLPPHMNMAFTGGDRVTNLGDWAVYHADGNGNWTEEEYYNFQFVQKFTVSAPNSVIMPYGYQRARFQLIGPAGTLTSFGPTYSPGAATTGAYCETLFNGCTAGGRFSVTIDTSSSGYCGIASGYQPGGFVFPGTTWTGANNAFPAQNYIATNGGGLVLGEIHDFGHAGTYVAGVRAYTPGIAYLNPITGLPISPPSEILAGVGPQFKAGIPDGGPPIGLNTTGANASNYLPGPPAVYITWLR